jgi:hypothetical protein
VAEARDDKGWPLCWSFEYGLWFASLTLKILQSVKAVLLQVGELV